MQTLINNFPFADSKAHSLIYTMKPMALSKVPFHKNAKSITRYFAENFPLYLAVHEVSPVTKPPLEYTKPHVHEDFDEVNIIISHHDLLYTIQLDDRKYTVSNNASIWIPRGTVHSANVLKGSGFFITLRIHQ
jgi:mannose-6-phosphate isomerase-like protein (cupin superfamily)